jgi:hydrogenase maturation protease
VPEPDRRARPLVVGVGAEDRSDDAVGLVVARALRDRPAFPADVDEEDGELTRLFERWSGRSWVLLVDGMRTGDPPGTIRRWGGTEAARLPSGTTVSSHGLPLADVLHLARGLGRLPPFLVLYGIEVGSTAPGRGLSPPVRAAVGEACDRIGQELADLAPTGPLARERPSDA